MLSIAHEHRSSQRQHRVKASKSYLQAFNTSRCCLYVFIVSLFHVGCSNAWDMKAVDISSTVYYKELMLRETVVVDKPHLQQISRRDQSTGETNSTANSIADTATGLPEPFDTSLGSNFSSNSCPNYFTKFLSNDTFQSCLPVSLLLQNSMSFFQATRSATLLNETLEASCAASLAVCSPLMTYFANQLISAGNCQDDYLKQNPLVMQAYSGLKAYEPVYQAACLKDKANEKYCFTEAMTSSNNTGDSYPYYTAIGIQLPTGSRPTCSSCLQHTMQLFSEYAVQRDQPLSQTYLNCAAQVNSGCGQSFASTEVQNMSKATSSNDTRRPNTSTSFVMIFVFLSILLI